MSRIVAFALMLMILPFTAVYAAGNIDKNEVQAIVKDYLMQNPEVIIDAIKAYQDKQAKADEAKAIEAISKNKDMLFNNGNVPNVGAKDADVVVAEFFDYHCGYCKHMLPTVTELLKNDPKLRVAFHEFPILSDDSTMAAKAAMAVFNVKPERYFEYHTALMNMKGSFTEQNLTAEAKKLGISEKELKAAMADPKLDQQIEQNRALAKQMGITGTPALIIGKEFIPGAASYEALKDIIDKQRQSNSKK